MYAESIERLTPLKNGPDSHLDTPYTTVVKYSIIIYIIYIFVNE